MKPPDRNTNSWSGMWTFVNAHHTWSIPSGNAISPWSPALASRSLLKGEANAPGTQARANTAARTVIVDRHLPEGPRHPPRRANRGVMEAGSLSSRRAKMLSNPPPPRSPHKLSSECWSGSLATRVRVIRRPHRAARRYEQCLGTNAEDSSPMGSTPARGQGAGASVWSDQGRTGFELA